MAASLKPLETLSRDELRKWIHELDDKELDKYLATLSDAELIAFRHDWHIWARDTQLLPKGDWRLWFINAGRGWGKTKTGAETVREWVDQGYMRIALVGPTTDDVKKVMITGEATGPGEGLLNIFPPAQTPAYIPSHRLIRFHTGAIALIYSSEEPERLRGPQHAKAWADEFRAWKYPEKNWSNLKFGLRQGDNPQIVLTTTPKPFPLYRELLKAKTTFVTRGGTYENKANLSPAFLEEMKSIEGTRLGRQELFAELLDDTPGALWTATLIEDTRVPMPDGETFLDRLRQAVVGYNLVRVVVGIDPSGSDNPDSDECGIYVAGLSNKREGFGLWDASLRASSDKWASVGLKCYHELDCDKIVAEKNFGGDMVETIIRLKDPNVKPKLVTASKGKYVRAEPVASLFEQGKIHLVGVQPKLEDEMTTWVADGTMKSPNRMDAMVWAFTELMVKGGSHSGLLEYLKRQTSESEDANR